MWPKIGNLILRTALSKTHPLLNTIIYENKLNDSLIIHENTNQIILSKVFPMDYLHYRLNKILII